MQPLTFAKAIVASLIAGLAAVATGLDDGSVDAQEIITALIAGLVALSAVWATPNQDRSEP